MHSFQQNARPHAQQAPPPHASQQTNSKASSMNNPNIHHNHQQQKSQQNQTFTSKFNSNMVYSTAHAQWTPQEFHLLQKALIDFPSTKYDNVTRYIKIAAAIPGKRVRDVAFKVKSMISSTTDCMAGNDHNIVVSQEPAPKRTKTEAHGARFTKLSTNNLPLPSNQQEQSPKNPVNINTLLQGNMMTINSMRSNLLGGRLDDNKREMIKFKDNYHTILNMLGNVNNSVPPLSLKLDTSLLPEDNQQEHL